MSLPDSIAEPAVSVVMPCYNGMPFLPAAIRAVLAQPVSLELVFVDVGSTDGSLEAARELGRSGLRAISAPPGTLPGPARNLGVASARAPLIAFADADDVWSPDKLARQLALLEESGAALAFSDCRVIDAQGAVLGRFLARHRPRGGRVWAHLLEENFVPLSTVLVRRADFEALGGFAQGFTVACDYEFLLRLARTRPLAFDPRPLADYRVHDRNLTRRFRVTYAENVEVFRGLAAASSDEAERAALRRAETLVRWRWALREFAAGFGSWGRGLAQAALTVRRVGPLRATTALATVLRAAARGMGVRFRMARARRGVQ